MDILLVAPAQLRTFWAQIKEGLEKMPAEDWIAEDVYHAIRSGESALYVGLNHSGFCGFLVLRKQETEFTHQPVLHVWLAYSKGDEDVFEAGESLIKQVADKMGASKITFGSPRKGWSKRYPMVTATYEVPR